MTMIVLLALKEDMLLAGFFVFCFLINSPNIRTLHLDTESGHVLMFSNFRY